ncbi:MAG: hypothetical protein H8E94_00310 [Alphaproteobacteria bacterium]|nr:hypothetical protein [Alphaproteobacteria bacterium]
MNKSTDMIDVPSRDVVLCADDMRVLKPILQRGWGCAHVHAKTCAAF